MLGKRLKKIVGCKIARSRVLLVNDRAAEIRQRLAAAWGKGLPAPHGSVEAYYDQEACSAWANEGGATYNSGRDH